MEHVAFRGVATDKPYEILMREAREEFLAWEKAMHDRWHASKAKGKAIMKARSKAAKGKQK